MTTPGKISFGNNPVPSYGISNGNFGYASGDNVTPSYSPYAPLQTISNPVTTSNYNPYQPTRDAPTQQFNTQPPQSTYVSGQVGNPIPGQYETNRNVSYAPPSTKITFGSKQFTSAYSPKTNYDTTGFVSPAQYQTYQAPVQIANPQILSQPIRQQVVTEPKVEQAKVSTKGSRVEVPPPVVQKSRKTKKGCPGWLWPLLGILALLALILGLLFGLGVFGRIGNVGKETVPIAATTGTTTSTTTDTTTAGATEGEPIAAGPGAVINGTSAVTTPIATVPTTPESVVNGTTAVTTSEPTGTGVTDYTGKGNQTGGVTYPTVVTPSATNTTTVTPQVVIPTTPTVVNPTTPTTVIPATTTTSTTATTTTTTVPTTSPVVDNSLTPTGAYINPTDSGIAPVAPTSTTTDYSSTSTGDVYPTSTSYPTASTDGYATAYPSTSSTDAFSPTPSGYGSNPSVDFVTPTSA